MLWALARLSPFTPHCIERRISRYGYHSSVANSTPGTVARIGSAWCPSRAYIPASFPDSIALSPYWPVPADILLSQPMLPNPLSRDQIAWHRHRLPRITNDAARPLAVLFLAQFRPGHLCRPSLIGLLDDEDYIVVAGSECVCMCVCVYDHFAMTVYIRYIGRLKVLQIRNYLDR